MFTGIIQTVGSVVQKQMTGNDAKLYIHTGKLSVAEIQLGDSIAVNGVCLTAVTLTEQGFWADVSAETLALTTLGTFNNGSRVNLELALTPHTRLGGHLVSGHVDGVGKVLDLYNDGRSLRVSMQAPTNLAKYIAAKGSICLDGISLTVNGVEGARFDVNIVPHTAEVTTWGNLQVGQAVNIEVDMLARYLERLLLGDKAAEPQTEPLNAAFLQRCGFSD